MIVLFIIVIIGITLYGYLLMSRIGKFIERGGFIKESEASSEKEILLYGETETIDIISNALDAAAITYDFTDEPAIKNGIIYHWIGAFSKDDADNLLICLSAKRKNNGIYTMARCNNNIYENVFKQTDITVIFQKDISVNRILAYLRG